MTLLWSVAINVINILMLIMKMRTRSTLRRSNYEHRMVPIKRAAHEMSFASHATTTVSQQQQHSHNATVQPSSKKLNNEMKATLCILFIIVNILVNEFPIVIVWPLSFECPGCISLDLFYNTMNMLFFFSVLNPIIFFIFYKSFRHSCIKQLKLFIFFFIKWTHFLFYFLLNIKKNYFFSFFN